VAEGDGAGVAAVLAADPQLQLLALAAAQPDRGLHQLAHAYLVQGGERVLLEDALLEVLGEEAGLGVVAGDAEGGLGEVVGAEGEELRVLGQAVRHQRGAGDLHHGAELVAHGAALLRHHLGRFLLQDGPFELQLRRVHGERDHHLGVDLHAVAGAGARRLEDGADLHPHQLRHVDAQAHAAQAQHRVLLAQALHRLQHLALLLEQVAQLRRAAAVQLQPGLQRHHLALQRVVVGEELVQRRVDEADGHRQPVHGAEQAVEVLPLERQQQLQALGLLRRVLGEDHPLHDGQPLGLEEHVLGAAPGRRRRGRAGRPGGSPRWPTPPAAAPGPPTPAG